MPEPQRALLARARALLAADPRVVAAWVEGSYAGGTADPWSDVDLHVAVADVAAFDGGELLGRVAPVISSLTFPLGPVRLVAATVEGPVRVDPYVEPVDQVASIPRLGPADVFHGDPPEFRIVESVMDPAALLARLVRGYFFGFMMPARLAGREMWASLVLNAVQVVFQFAVPAMLARSNPSQIFREALHAERHLTPEQQQKVRELVAAIGERAAGVADGPPDEAAVRRAHELVIGTLLHELRAACEQNGVEWPAESETAARGYLGGELDLAL